jgi:hypothetical protein
MFNFELVAGVGSCQCTCDGDQVVAVSKFMTSPCSCQYEMMAKGIASLTSTNCTTEQSCAYSLLSMVATMMFLSPVS